VVADFIQFLPALGKGAVTTAILCIIAGVAGSVLGLIIGIMRSSSWAVVRWISAIFTNFLRGIPLLIILLFTYFALPLLIPGAIFSQLVSGAIGLTLFVSAYIAEVVRGSIESVPKGQFEAAEALGMNFGLKFRYIIMPQAMRVIVPPWVGIILAMIKDSSLVSVIGLVELTQAGKIVGTSTMEPLVAFVLVGAVYFVICFPLGHFGRWYEKRLRQSGYRVPHEATATDILDEEPGPRVGGNQ
jgi:polar amino acid transport system permease protein